MKWFNHIFGIQDIPMPIPGQQESQQDIEDEDEDIAVASLNIILLKSQNIQVLAEWAEESEEMVDVYSKMIHYIVSGKVKALIVDQLDIYRKTGYSSPSFITSLLNKIDATTGSLGGPVVAPSKALKIAPMLKD